MSKILGFGFQAKLLVMLECLSVRYGVVVEGDAVKTQVRTKAAFLRLAFQVAALNVVEGRGAKRQRRLRWISAAADDVDVGGVVGPGGGGDGALVQGPLFTCEHF